jgi:hypothetical protein
MSRSLRGEPILFVLLCGRISEQDHGRMLDRVDDLTDPVL